MERGIDRHRPFLRSNPSTHVTTAQHTMSANAANAIATFAHVGIITTSTSNAAIG